MSDAPATWPSPPPASADLYLAKVEMDLKNVFSPTGTFTDSDFASGATVSPRVAGPDGRLEVSAMLKLVPPSLTVCEEDVPTNYEPPSLTVCEEDIPGVAQ